MKKPWLLSGVAVVVVAEVTVTFTESTSETEMGLVRENGAWCLAWFGD